MRKILVSFFAAAGILIFATAAWADCNGIYERPLDVVQTDSATTGTPPVKLESDG